MNDDNWSDYHERLLRQQLHSGEGLDGIFLVGPHVTAAVTSERLMVIRPTKANGWEMKSVPWRLVTGLTVEATTLGTSQESRIHLRYDTPTKNGTRGANPMHPPLASTLPESGTTDPPGEMTLTLAADGQPMATFLNARLAGVLTV